MDQKHKDIINEVIGNVFSSTAFMFPEPSDLPDGVNLEEQEMIEVDLNYDGHQDGSLALVVPLVLCKELYDNMSGEDFEEDEVPLEDQLDAIKELLNIIAGQLLTKIHGDKAVFNLTDLMARKLEENEFFELIENQDYVCNMADDYLIILVLSEKRKEYEC